MSAANHWAIGVGPYGYTLLGFKERRDMMTWVAGNLRDRREVVVVLTVNITRIYSGISAMYLGDFDADIVRNPEPGEVLRYVLPWS